MEHLKESPDVPEAEMLEPSAILLLKNNSYFSGFNLSFLTSRHQSDRSQCINLKLFMTQTAFRVLILVGWSARLGESSCSMGCRAVGVWVDSGGTLGGSAPEILRCPPVHFHLEASARIAQSSKRRVSDPHFIRHRPVSMTAEGTSSFTEMEPNGDNRSQDIKTF